MALRTTSDDKEVTDALRHHLALLLEADEPEALLGSLTRIVEHKIRLLIADVKNREEAARWSIVLEALTKVRHEMTDLHGIYFD
jgi:translation initiation factor 2B subunit (eIF-2B alpha/beta/delta family)